MVKIIKKLRHHIEIMYEGNIYNIETEVFYKYNLKEGSILTKSDFSKMLNDNDYYYFDRFSKNKLKKMLTEYELRDILTKAGANPALINDLMENYLYYKYIDDENYVKTYIEYKGNREGPKLIRAKLFKKGIETNLINKYLTDFDEDLKIESLAKRLIQINKHLNRQELKNKITSNILSKGYSYDQINNIVDNLLSQVEINEEPLIIKEFNKQLKKYQDKLNRYELTQTIKQKLYNKGYNSTLIEKVLENL